MELERSSTNQNVLRWRGEMTGRPLLGAASTSNEGGYVLVKRPWRTDNNPLYRIAEIERV